MIEVDRGEFLRLGAAQQIAWLRGTAGKVSPAGLFSPIDLEPAAEQLDAFLSTPDFPD